MYSQSTLRTPSGCVSGTDTPRPATAPPPRVKPEAQEIATISQGTRIRPIIHERSTDGPTPRQARVKPEGEGIATASRGKRMKTIIHEFAQHRPSPRQPRVKAEAEGTAEVAKVRVDFFPLVLVVCFVLFSFFISFFLSSVFASPSLSLPSIHYFFFFSSFFFFSFFFCFSSCLTR